MHTTVNKTISGRVIGLEPKTAVSACGVMRFQSDKVGVSKHSCSGIEGTANPGLRFAKLIAMSGEKRGEMQEQKYRKRVSKAGQKLRRTIDTMLDLVDAGCDIFIALPGGTKSIGSHKCVGTTLVMITVVNGPMQVAFFKVNGLKAEKTKTHYLTKRGLTRPQPTSQPANGEK